MTFLGRGFVLSAEHPARPAAELADVITFKVKSVTRSRRRKFVCEI